MATTNEFVSGDDFDAILFLFQTQINCVSSQQQKAELSYINPKFYTECAHLLTVRYFQFIHIVSDNIENSRGDRGCIIHNTGLLFVSDYFSYRINLHTRLLFVSDNFSYRINLHTGLLFIPDYFSYRVTFHTGLILVSDCFSYQIA